MKNLRVSIQNFGPVHSGTLNLKPLTVFVGPNNSGKSYTAVLIYVFARYLMGKEGWPFLGEFDALNRKRKEIDRSLFDILANISSKTMRLSYTDLPEVFRGNIQEQFTKAFSSLEEVITDAICREYFACNNIKQLVCRTEKVADLSVTFAEEDSKEPFLTYTLNKETNVPKSTMRLPNLDPLTIPAQYLLKRGPKKHPEYGYIIWSFWWQLIASLGFPLEVFYLPSARSGILQGWQTYSTLALRMVRSRFGFERIEMPPFSGVVGDFLEDLLEAFSIQRQTEKMPSVLEILESEVLRGQISMVQQKTHKPEIRYTSGGLNLSLQQVSSMVAELAPLDLWIKNLLTHGSLLVIDEPEAHLHPAAQRGIARVLVRLVKEGVSVICTTHSSTILHQLSNHLLASESDEKVRSSLGYTDSDLLSAKELGVYVFHPMDNGTRIKEVPIEPGFGISEDEFVGVAEAIGEQTFRISKGIGHHKVNEKR